MNVFSFRQIAEMLGVSVATVSRVIHQDPRVRPETARRVTAFLEKHNYNLDPVVSVALSRIRSRSFYRESMMWCGDCPREEMPWLKTLYASLEDFGARLGYKIEYSHFNKTDPRHLEHLTSIWAARGVRGILLGPFSKYYKTLPFPWERFAWVTIGASFDEPFLHHVGRDYVNDISTALDWLKTQGCRRPCFIEDSKRNHIIKQHMLQGALLYYQSVRRRPPRPYYELDTQKPRHFEAWLKANRPDGLILPGILAPKLNTFVKLIATLPTVVLSPPAGALKKPNMLSFTARYDVLGQIAVNMLHRLLGNREFGIPGYKQSALVNSAHDPLTTTP